MSYSSPAQSKIMEELGLSVADVSPPYLCSYQYRFLFCFSESQTGSINQTSKLGLNGLILFWPVFVFHFGNDIRRNDYGRV